MIMTFNTFSLACLITFWRIFGEPLWLPELLISLYIFCLYVTYKYRHAVPQGIFSAKGRKTRFGKIYWRSAFVILLISGGDLTDKHGWCKKRFDMTQH